MWRRILEEAQMWCEMVVDNTSSLGRRELLLYAFVLTGYHVHGHCNAEAFTAYSTRFWQNHPCYLRPSAIAATTVAWGPDQITISTTPLEQRSTPSTLTEPVAIHTPSHIPKMTPTISIGSSNEFSKILSTSSIVITDCMISIWSIIESHLSLC